MSMSTRWQAYRQAADPLPDCNLTWPFGGNGLESVGINGRPTTTPMPTCGPDEILVRVDALGLCASDAKMVRMGSDYPLFFARDFDETPAQLGHEAALTVVEVGEAWRAQYYPGQRLGIQPDVYFEQKRAIFGVNIPGAMAQYVTLDRRVLASDFGSCVFPVSGDVSYADVALLEPWACVDVAYNPHARRLTPKKEGVLWIKGRTDDSEPYEIDYPLESKHIVLTDVQQTLANQLKRRFSGVVERPHATASEIVAEFAPDSGLDDVILLDPIVADDVATAVAHLAYHGTLNLVTNRPLSDTVAVDMHKLHYQHLALLGCPGPDAAAAYGVARNRSELRAGGVTWIAGAGGTMGRIHIRRALQMPDGPRAIIATNRGQERVTSLIEDFSALAAANDCELIAFSPQTEPERLTSEINRLTGEHGCDDIVVIVPDPVVVSEALPFLAPDGMLVIFAGMQAGNWVNLPLDCIALHQAQISGTSGSTVADQLRLLEKIQNSTLSAAQTIAAVGGMAALRDGLHAVLEKTYPGKVVIYPQLVNLPLTSLPDLANTYPTVYQKLGPGHTWTKQAEQMLFTEAWHARGEN